MARRIWRRTASGRLKKWKHKGDLRPEARREWGCYYLHEGASRLWNGKSLHCFHFHVPRWFNVQFYIRPERARVKQLLRMGQYERAEIESRRTWKHQGAWDWA